ncbi:MAG TPA: hypothetical protein VM842_06155 [Nitrospira sp.]|nr:hypothetical protein [Nitrospira sp.]
MIEVAVRHNNCTWPPASAESGARRSNDIGAGKWQAGIDKNPTVIASLRLAEENDVDQYDLPVRDVIGNLARSIVTMAIV